MYPFEVFEESEINYQLQNFKIVVQKKRIKGKYIISSLDFPETKVVQANTLDEGIDILKTRVKNLIKKRP